MRIIEFHRNYSSENMLKIFSVLVGWTSRRMVFECVTVCWHLRTPEPSRAIWSGANRLLDKKKSLPVFSMAINDRCGCVCIAFACNNRDDAHPTSNKNLLTHERWQAPNRICIIKRCRCSVVWSGISSRNSNRCRSRNWKRSNWILLIGRWNKHVRVLWAFYCFEQARSIVK